MKGFLLGRYVGAGMDLKVGLLNSISSNKIIPLAYLISHRVKVGSYSARFAHSLSRNKHVCPGSILFRKTIPKDISDF